MPANSQTRRSFLGSSAITALALCDGPVSARPRTTIKAVAFDAFVIFDARPVLALVKELVPEKGQDLFNLWRTRQFEYTWLRTLSREYADFGRVTEEALAFACNSLAVNLSANGRRRLVHSYLELRCWPDVPNALRALKAAGMRSGLLSNMSEEMLHAGIRNSDLSGSFERVLSTDRVRVYKPAPGAYEMGVEAFGCKREEILFAAFAGWDAAGAKAFGYPTFWVNRQSQPAEELGMTADASGPSMDNLLAWLKIPSDL